MRHLCSSKDILELSQPVVYSGEMISARAYQNKRWINIYACMPASRSSTSHTCCVTAHMQFLLSRILKQQESFTATISTFSHLATRKSTISRSLSRVSVGQPPSLLPGMQEELLRANTPASRCIKSVFTISGPLLLRRCMSAETDNGIILFHRSQPHGNDYVNSAPKH